MKPHLFFVSVLMLFILTSCSGGGGSTTESSSLGEEQKEGLLTFADDAELQEYLKSGFRSSSENLELRDYTTALDVDVAGTVESDQAVNSPAVAYSKTTLQETGVDEADRVKSDGHFLYLAPRPDSLSYDPMDRVAVSAEESEGAVSDRIRIFALTDDPAGAKEVATIALDHFRTQISGLYLVTERADADPDVLIAVGGTQNNVWSAWSCAWCWQNTRTEVSFFDVTLPQEPQQISHLSIDGQLIASRRIDNKLYLVTRYAAMIPDFDTYPVTPLEKEQNEALLDAVTLADLLPAIRINDAPATPLVTPESTYLPMVKPEEWIDPTLITITAIDLSDPTRYEVASLAGPAETVYVSSRNLYVATTRHHYRPLIGMLDETSTKLNDVAPETTEIHKFKFTENGPIYKGSGVIDGNLGWDHAKRPFRFGENGGILRVATSLGDTWNATSTTRLTLLREGVDGGLETLSYLDNIGETGERLYAVRYVGDRAYLVTFRVTDPLYVFDLSDPSAPVMAGELHIQGYSDYLHPLDETHLLGIGKDAIPDAASTDFDGRGAWYQGVKLSLFDVADPATPQEIDSVVIGKRGTQSDALYDHHAFTFLPASADAPARIAVPIELHDTVYSEPWFTPENPWTSYDWTHTGLYFFEITDAAIQQVGRLVVEDRSAGIYYPDYSNRGQDRSVIVNDSLHYVHGNKLWSTPWGGTPTILDE